jgi:1,4-dihydroxy-2-naphthoyl-CoA hydrolase
MNQASSVQALLAPLFPGLLGIRLDEVTSDRVTATLLVRENLCTVGGILHGGAMMALADTLGAVGAYLNLPQGKRTSTIESSTKFVGAARVGTTVHAESTVVHRGRTTEVWQTALRSEDGRLCGLVTQTQLILEAAS